MRPVVLLLALLLIPAAWAAVPRSETKPYEDRTTHPTGRGTTWIDFTLDGTESRVRFALDDDSGLTVSGMWGFWRSVPGTPYLEYAGGGGFCGQSGWVHVPDGSVFVNVHPDTAVWYDLVNVNNPLAALGAAGPLERCGATVRGFATTGNVTADFA